MKMMFHNEISSSKGTKRSVDEVCNRKFANKKALLREKTDQVAGNSEIIADRGCVSSIPLKEVCGGEYENCCDGSIIQISNEKIERKIKNDVVSLNIIEDDLKNQSEGEFETAEISYCHITCPRRINKEICNTEEENHCDESFTPLLNEKLNKIDHFREIVSNKIHECDSDGKSKSENSPRADEEYDAVKEIYGINKLPVEILMEIFEHLLLRDRNSVRLVCKSWYYACNTRYCLAEEKFNLCALYDVDKTLDVILNSERKYLNLSFYDMTFDDCHMSFWEKCGHKIYTLHFSNCLLSDEVFEKMVVHCINLEELSWKVCSSSNNGNRLCSAKVIDKLIKNKIIRESLILMELDLYDSKIMSNYVLNGIFSIFSNIRLIVFNVEIIENDFNSIEINNSKLQSVETFTFSSIYNKIKMSQDSIEGLEFGFNESSTTCFVFKMLADLSSLTRLTEIVMDIYEDDETYIEFVSRQKQLLSFDCEILFNNAERFTNRLLTVLFSECVNLSKLLFWYEGLLEISSELFQKIISSHLVSLSFYSDLFFNIHKNYSINNTLLSLTINSISLDESITLILIEKFCNLGFLEVQGVNDNILQAIFKYQVNLSCLKLIDYEVCTDFGFTGQLEKNELSFGLPTYSIQRLRRLEYLEMKVYAPAWRATIKTIHELIFPNLKYLHLIFEGDYEFYVEFLMIFKNSPLLEGIYFESEKQLPFDKLETLCRTLKKLRFLHIQHREGDMLAELEFQNMFHNCPSLRAFKYSSSEHDVSYYYDSLEKNIKQKMGNNQFCVSSETVDDLLFVDWLWF